MKCRVGDSFTRVMTPWQTAMQVATRTGSVLLYLLVAVFTADVIGRYVLGVTAAWVIDLEWYLGTGAVALALAPALLRDKHVRVSVLRARWSAATNAWIDRLGHLVLLLPLCGFVVYAGSRYAYNSFLVGEGSPDPGGLPYRWAVKVLVPLGFALLAGEGLRQLLAQKPAKPEELS